MNAVLDRFLDRIENLANEIDGLKDDLKNLKAEAKSAGFNVRALVKLVKIRQRKARLEQENTDINDLVLYAAAAGVPLDIVDASVDSHESPVEA